MPQNFKDSKQKINNPQLTNEQLQEQLKELTYRKDYYKTQLAMYHQTYKKKITSVKPDNDCLKLDDISEVAQHLRVLYESLQMSCAKDLSLPIYTHFVNENDFIPWLEQTLINIDKAVQGMHKQLVTEREKNAKTIDTKEVAKILSEMEECRIRMDNITAQHKSKEEELINTCEEKIESLEAEIQVKTQEMEQWSEFMKKQSQEMSVLTQERDNALMEKDEMAGKYTYVSKEMEIWQEKYTLVTKQLENEMQKQMTTQKQLQDEIYQKKQEIITLQKDKHNTEEILDKKDAQIKFLQNAIEQSKQKSQDKNNNDIECLQKILFNIKKKQCLFQEILQQIGITTLTTDTEYKKSVVENGDNNNHYKDQVTTFLELDYEIGKQEKIEIKLKEIVSDHMQRLQDMDRKLNEYVQKNSNEELVCIDDDNDNENDHNHNHNCSMSQMIERLESNIVKLQKTNENVLDEESSSTEEGSVHEQATPTSSIDISQLQLNMMTETSDVEEEKSSNQKTPQTPMDFSDVKMDNEEALGSDVESLENTRRSSVSKSNTEVSATPSPTKERKQWATYKQMKQRMDARNISRVKCLVEKTEQLFVMPKDGHLCPDNKNHKHAVRRMCCDPGGEIMVSVDISGEIRFWSIPKVEKNSNMKLICMYKAQFPMFSQLENSKSLSIGCCVAFSSNGQYCAVGGSVDAVGAFGIVYLFEMIKSKPSLCAAFVSSSLTMYELPMKDREEPSAQKKAKSCVYAKIVSLHFALKDTVLLAGDCKSNLVVFEKRKTIWIQQKSVRVTSESMPVQSICVCRNEHVIIANGSCQYLYHCLLTNLLSNKKIEGKIAKNKICLFRPLPRHRSDKLEAFLVEWDPIHDCLYVCSRKVTCYQLLNQTIELKKLNTGNEQSNDSKDWIATLSMKTDEDQSMFVMSRSKDHMFKLKRSYVTLIYKNEGNKEEWKHIILSDTSQVYHDWPIMDCQLINYHNNIMLVTCFQKINSNLSKASSPYFILHSLLE